MPTAEQQPIDVAAFIDQRRVSPYQVMIVVLCFLVVAIDGFDTAAIGFIAPAISAQWQLAPAQLAPVFGAGLFGLMLGALLIGPFADRFGRKTVLLLCVFFFGAMSLASAWSTSLDMLFVLRFLTGLGLGGAMPNAITLTAEYCPERRRSLLVMTMFCGFTIGSALGGLASANLVEAHGWHSVLILGGILPLLLLPVLALLLPESARYLVAMGKRPDGVTRILQRIAPQEALHGASYRLPPQPSAGLPLAHLFRPELLRGTLLMWLAFFMSMLVIYLLSSWLPTLLKATGISLKTAALITMMFQVGGTLGAIVLGWLMDRANPHYVLAAAYALAALFIAAIGHVTATPWLVGMVVFLAGFCVSGGQVGANALSAMFYPTECRATGVSWANGIGRIGSVVGSLGGGAMLAAALTLPSLFMIVGIPALLAGLTLAALGIHRGRAAEKSRKNEPGG
jgi:AAHS family 4-hydroxybenzoate transporter-like MFS transporter